MIPCDDSGVKTALLTGPLILIGRKLKSFRSHLDQSDCRARLYAEPALSRLCIDSSVCIRLRPRFALVVSVATIDPSRTPPRAKEPDESVLRILHGGCEPPHNAFFQICECSRRPPSRSLYAWVLFPKSGPRYGAAIYVETPCNTS